MDNKIKIVLGVTGHRDIRKEDDNKIYEKVYEYILSLRNKYKNIEFIMLNSLASGADIICAEVAERLGIDIICPLPMDVEEYEKDFDEKDLSRFRNLLKNCKYNFIVKCDDSDRSKKYREAGKYVSDNSNILIALWDGLENKISNCGTSGIVNYTIANNSIPIHHIKIGRVSNDIESTMEEKNLNKEVFSFEEIEEYNKDIYKTQTDSYSVYGNEGCPKELKHLDEMYMKTDSLSNFFQKKYLSIVLILAIFAVIVVISYLLYDEADFLWMLIVYPVSLIIYYLIYKIGDNSSIHKKYYSYRVFAEALRVQIYLLSINVKENVTKYFTWTQKCDLEWIENAMKSIVVDNTINTPIIDFERIKIIWVEAQLSYHKNAIKKKNAKIKINNMVSMSMMAFTLILYVIVVFTEFHYNNFLSNTIFDISIRSLLKIVWGLFSAISLFVSSYYGKLSLNRQVTDHEKMKNLYEDTLKKLEQSDDDKIEILKNLAKEEIVENGEWMSYVAENSFSFSF